MQEAVPFLVAASTLEQKVLPQLSTFSFSEDTSLVSGSNYQVFICQLPCISMYTEILYIFKFKKRKPKPEEQTLRDDKAKRDQAAV